jgi:hypothetical protein
LTKGKADYHDAIERWMKKFKSRTVLCFIQFKGVEVTVMPRAYLATPQEVAKRLHDSVKGRGDTILYEYHKWSPRAEGAGTVEKIPEAWRFSPEQVEHLFNTA